MDGHWVLSFPDAEAAHTARDLVDQHQAKLRAAEQHHNKQLDSALQAAAQEQREAQQAADESIAAAVAEVEQRCKVEVAAR